MACTCVHTCSFLILRTIEFEFRLAIIGIKVETSLFQQDVRWCCSEFGNDGQGKNRRWRLWACLPLTHPDRKLRQLLPFLGGSVSLEFIRNLSAVYLARVEIASRMPWFPETTDAEEHEAWTGSVPDKSTLLHVPRTLHSEKQA